MAFSWVYSVNASISLPCTNKNPPKWQVLIRKLSIAPWVLPHAYAKGLGKPDQNAAQHCVNAWCCGHDDVKHDKPQDGWAFRVNTRNVDSLL